MATYSRVIGILVLAGAVAVGVNWYKAAYADVQQNVPGSSSDPVVTKSYVDQKITESLKSSEGTPASTAGNKLEVITLPVGKRIIVEAGGEIIVRTGKAVAYSSDSNGLSDLTAGVDVPSGKSIATNHLILFPRGGRGIEPDSSQNNSVTLLVIGKYEIL